MLSLIATLASITAGTAAPTKVLDDDILLQSVATSLHYSTDERDRPPAIGAFHPSLQAQLRNISGLVVNDDVGSTFRRVEALAAEEKGAGREHSVVTIYFPPKVLLPVSFCELAQARTHHASRLGERRARYIIIGGIAENGGVLSHPMQRYTRCLDDVSKLLSDSKLVTFLTASARYTVLLRVASGCGALLIRSCPFTLMFQSSQESLPPRLVQTTLLQTSNNVCFLVSHQLEPLGSSGADEAAHRAGPSLNYSKVRVVPLGTKVAMARLVSAAILQLESSALTVSTRSKGDDGDNNRDGKGTREQLLLINNSGGAMCCAGKRYPKPADAAVVNATTTASLGVDDKRGGFDDRTGEGSVIGNGNVVEDWDRDDSFDMVKSVATEYYTGMRRGRIRGSSKGIANAIKKPRGRGRGKVTPISCVRIYCKKKIPLTTRSLCEVLTSPLPAALTLHLAIDRQRDRQRYVHTRRRVSSRESLPPPVCDEPRQ